MCLFIFAVGFGHFNTEFLSSMFLLLLCIKTIGRYTFFHCEEVRGGAETIPKHVSKPKDKKSTNFKFIGELDYTQPKRNIHTESKYTKLENGNHISKNLYIRVYH